MSFVCSEDRERKCANKCWFLSSQFVAVVLAVGGVILFAYEDGFDAVSNVLGVVLSVGSAVGAAFYKVMHGFCVSLVS